MYFIGNGILNKERQLAVFKSRNDYDSCIKLRPELEELRRQRDSFDAVYETSRYERMIVMRYNRSSYLFRRPTTAELLAEEENQLKLQRERLQRERLEKERLELELRIRELEEKNRLAIVKVNSDDEYQAQSNPVKFPERKRGRNKMNNYVDYVNQPIKKPEKEEKYVDELKYNQGDKDLDPFFAPLARSAGGNIPAADLSVIKQAHRKGILTVTGVRLFSALICDNWKLREAAVKSWLEFIQNPIVNIIHNCFNRLDPEIFKQHAVPFSC